MVIALLLGGVVWLLQPPPPDWLYTGQLHAAIRDADRIVVLDGGNDWSETVNAYPVLFEIQDAQHVREVQKHFVFKVNQYAMKCACQGYPVIAWYHGDERIAYVSLQHGRAIRWDAFQGDATLSDESGQWIVQWLVRNGVPKAALE